MSTHENSDTKIQVWTDAYYEERASQEEIYLEETEEELRVILEYDDPLPSQTEDLNEQREHAAEELITGDADDPPLSDEVVEGMLLSGSNPKIKRA